MPALPLLILLSGLVTLALWRRSQGPIEVSKDDPIFGRGQRPPEDGK